ncbi:MAG: hypothetical protein EXS25_02220 [Pedosphaera sp.]|nr:hypothetical protein [Pedosphaera sp.]
MLHDSLLARLPGDLHGGKHSQSADQTIRGVTTHPDRAGPNTNCAVLPSTLSAAPVGIQTALKRGTPAIICPPDTALTRRTRRIVADQPSLTFVTAAALNNNPVSHLHLFRVRLPENLSAQTATLLHRLLEASDHRSALLTSHGGCIAGRHFLQSPSETDCHEWQCFLAAHVRTGGRLLVIEDVSGVRNVLGHVPPRSESIVSLPSNSLIEPLALNWRGSRIRIRVGPSERLAHTPVVGRSSLAALDAAFVAAVAAGADPSRLAALLTSFDCDTGFMEPIRAGQSFGVFIDAATEATALERLIREAREMTQGSVILLTGASARSTPEQQRQLGEAASQADQVNLTSDNPRSIEVDSLSRDIQHGLNQTAHLQPDRRRAISDAIRMARSGDIVLLAGKGTHPIQEINGTILPWDDRTHARNGLAACGWVGDLP